MITGNKSDIAKVLPYVGEGLQKALAYIAATDFAHIENGEYEIDGRNVFARVNTYATEPKAERRSEKHNDYIDVQFVARGEEEIWFAPLEEKYVVTEDLSEENDVLFYADPQEANCVKLSEGDFAVFFPWELHRPNCQRDGKASDVQKIVVKVKAL